MLYNPEANPVKSCDNDDVVVAGSVVIVVPAFGRLPTGYGPTN